MRLQVLLFIFQLNHGFKMRILNAALNIHRFTPCGSVKHHYPHVTHTCASRWPTAVAARPKGNIGKRFSLPRAYWMHRLLSPKKSVNVSTSDVEEPSAASRGLPTLSVDRTTGA
jgi:hypothetical protein